MNLDKSNWKKVRFGDVVFEKKITVEAKSCGLERYIAGEHMVSEDLHLRSWGTIGDDYLGPAFHRKFEKGDILYGSRRTYLKKVAIADFDGVTANTTFVLRENTDLVVPGFIPFLMLSDTFTEHSVRNSKGSVNPYINYKDIAQFQFLLPPKDQQARLAELLWAGDAVVEGYGRLLTKLLDTQQAFSLHQYQDRTKPSSNLYSIAEINPRIPKDLRDNELTVSFLAMADVSDEGQIINHQKRKLGDVRKGFSYFAEGDILFAKITPCMENGKGALAEGLENGHGFGSTEFHVIRPFKESDRLYCFYLSQMDIFRKEAEKLMVGSAGQKRVQVDFFEYFSLHMPSEGKRQVFGEKMKSFEKERMRIKMLTENARLLQSTLLHQIFTS